MVYFVLDLLSVRQISGVYAWVYVCVHVHVWVCMWKPQDHLSCHYSKYHQHCLCVCFCFGTGLLVDLELANLGRLAGQKDPKDQFMCIYLTNFRITGACYHAHLLLPPPTFYLTTYSLHHLSFHGLGGLNIFSHTFKASSLLIKSKRSPRAAREQREGAGDRSRIKT